ncbi:MAG: hypothetical protein RBR48_05515 [Bacilli bacterium]|jgi:hypothetical protein|nr:hypothetical protein [Bacilli bacterium]MDD3348238.1 hypothetical protein [Bacilli bacterium]MDD4056271.1 hypothetical protein [Bacilli bacterium]MDY0209612.1 hypothetical protein [Bacilli bacterium]
MKKYLICFFLTISVVLVAIMMIVLKPSSTVKLTTVKKAYSYVSCFQEEENMQISILINDLNHSITNKEKYSSISIADKVHHNEIVISLEEIEYCDETYIINNETFYQYIYSFCLPFKTEDKFLLEIEDAYLCMQYRNIDINLAIGSFSYYKVPYFGDGKAYLSISKLKPIVNDFNQEKILVAVVVGINNQTKQEIIIKKIVALDLNLQFDGADFTILEDEVFPNSNISTLLGKSYTIHSMKDIDSEVFLTIPPNTAINYLLPIKYHGTLKTNKMGFLIEYTIGAESNTLYYDEFLFFTTTANRYPEVTVLTVDNE